MSERRAAIVTGGSRGIGKAIALKLASDGCDVAIVYRGSEDKALEVVNEIKAMGVEAVALKADVANSEDCKNVVALTKEAFGRVDILVNNAGITKDGLMIRMKDEDFDAVIDANLKGAFYMMREAMPIMMKAGYGKVVNISSVSGVLGNAGQANYSASKAGLIGLTKTAAREYASKRINVNAVAPGMIETDMTSAMSDKAKEGLVSTIPFKKMGDPDDIAEAVCFLASDKAAYITGQVLCVDGGMAI